MEEEKEKNKDIIEIDERKQVTDFRGNLGLYTEWNNIEVRKTRSKKRCYIVGSLGDCIAYSVVDTTARSAKRRMYKRFMEDFDLDYFDIRVFWVKNVKVEPFPVGFVFGDAYPELGLSCEESMTLGIAAGIYAYCEGGGMCLRCGETMSCLRTIWHIDRFPYAVCNDCSNEMEKIRNETGM